MSGVDFYPHSGVDFYPHSGVDFYPRRRGPAMTTDRRVLDPSCAAIRAVLSDMAAVVANGRDVGFIRNAAAHSIGLNVFAVLAAPQHHERLEDLAKSFKVFPDMKDIPVNSQLL